MDLFDRRIAELPEGSVITDVRGVAYMILYYPEGHVNAGDPVAVRPLAPFKEGTETFSLGALRDAHDPIEIIHRPRR